MGTRLTTAFDARSNSFNALRLLLALGVIVIHSVEVTGRHVDSWPLRQFLESVWVDGFFAISGFLIYRSWVRRPDARAFVKARALRILPAFYVCLIATAVVFAPLGALLAGDNPFGVLLSASAATYVLANSAVYIFQTGIAGGPEGVPHAGYWNVSLWTLAWELACYVGVLAAGVTGLLRRNWALPIFAAGSWLLSLAGALGLHHVAPVSHFSRFTLMFLVGALLFKYAHRVPASWASVAVSLSVVAVCLWLPDYRLIGAPFLAHALLVIGSRVRHARLDLRNDLSYGTYIYAFPAQQLLVLAGLGSIPLAAFAALSVACTLPLAAFSWFMVEKKALRRKAPAAVRQQEPSPVS